MSPQQAARATGHQIDRPARQPEPEEWVALDHPDRRIAQPATMGPIFMRVDRTSELPLVVAVQTGTRMKVVARFAHPGDCALAFTRLGDKQPMLPAKIVEQLAGQ